MCMPIFFCVCPCAQIYPLSDFRTAQNLGDNKNESRIIECDIMERGRETNKDFYSLTQAGSPLWSEAGKHTVVRFSCLLLLFSLIAAVLHNATHICPWTKKTPFFCWVLPFPSQSELPSLSHSFMGSLTHAISTSCKEPFPAVQSSWPEGQTNEVHLALFKAF